MGARIKAWVGHTDWAPGGLRTPGQSVARWRQAGHAGDQSDLKQRSSGFVREEDRGGREGEAGKILKKKAKEVWFFSGQNERSARGRSEQTTGGKEWMGG